MIPRRFVLIAAAGGGARFGGAQPKQYAELAGRPLIERTLEAIVTAVDVAGVVVALAPDDALFATRVAPREDVEALHCGGGTRAETVANALVAMATRWRDDDWVLVHDAARPCVPASALRRLVSELDGDAVGGLLAVPVADTLKRADGLVPPRVLRSEAREGLWQAQTPQMFRYGVLRAAFARPGAIGVTDEAQAVEALAATGACAMPRLIEGSALNLKVTFPADLALAAAILALEGRSG